MKRQGSSYCCRWFTLFLVAAGIVLVSPDIHLTSVDNYKQAKTKRTTAKTITSAMRTFKTLETMVFIDANRYNANKKYNSVNSYDSNTIASSNINSHSNSNRNRNGNTTTIRVPINEERSQQLEQSEKWQVRMISTPRTMTIIVEKPTIVEHTTATSIAAISKSTTAITKATTHIDGAIKMPPGTAANINVSDRRKSTMIYQQQLLSQHMPHQQWQQNERHRNQKQQKPHRPQVNAVRNGREKEAQSFVVNTLLGHKTTTYKSIKEETPLRNGMNEMIEASQTQIAIRNNSNSNSNVGSVTTAIISAITTAPKSITTMPTTQDRGWQFESLHISNNSNADDNNKVNVKATMTRESETALVLDRQHQHKFSSSYLDDNNIADEHNYARTLEHLSAQRNRWTRQVEEDPINKCRQFELSEEGKNEFYSPDFPNNYPKNINCTRVIIAPKGQIIRLDFRNAFHIEAKEDCKFDFLEIRNGQYGFSKLIGTYCGTTFPPVITSTERYLWLHFQSDESIEYSGFTAVYEFIDRRKEAPSTDLNCTIEKGGDDGFANSTDVPEEHRETVLRNKIALDCIWRIQVRENWKIQVKFLGFKLGKPNDCHVNFLDIFPEETTMPRRLKNFCGSAGEGIQIDSNVLNIRFFAEPVAINSTFSILYTAFRDREAGCIAEEEFDCDDATCISRELRCNGRDNCKFRWDEDKCTTEEVAQSEHMIIIMVVFGLILGGMVITFLVNCIRKILHDQKIIREHLRQSKDSRLNELGRNSKARSRENLSSTMPRRKHSQTSLQIVDDTSNHYYREVLPMSRLSSKPDLKDREHSILRHRNDMVVQTSFSATDGDDNSSETTAEAQAIANACDMGCQTRESLFAPPLMHQSSMGSLKDKASLHSHSRFSTFGYDATQPTPPPPTASGRGQLTGLNIRDAHGYADMRQRQATSKSTMPHMHRMNALPPTPLTPGTPAETCHHHHQHARSHVHTQQQPQHPLQKHSATQQQQQLSMQQSKECTTSTATTTPAQGKVKPKLSQSTAYIDIRNSAPDVIIMTSH